MACLVRVHTTLFYTSLYVQPSNNHRGAYSAWVVLPISYSSKRQAPVGSESKETIDRDAFREEHGGDKQEARSPSTHDDEGQKEGGFFFNQRLSVTKPVHQITQNLVWAEGAEKGPAFLARARGCSLVVDSSLRKLRKNTAIRKKETGVTTWRTKQRSRLACLALLDSRERLHVHLLPRLHTSSRKPANR